MSIQETLKMVSFLIIQTITMQTIINITRVEKNNPRNYQKSTFQHSAGVDQERVAEEQHYHHTDQNPPHYAESSEQRRDNYGRQGSFLEERLLGLEKQIKKITNLVTMMSQPSPYQPSPMQQTPYYIAPAPPQVFNRGPSSNANS